MSRIRTIKPDFWTDEKIVQLPFEARLFFIGMWNFADDEGYLSDQPDRIKLQVLPADEIDAWAIVDLLVAAESPSVRSVIDQRHGQFTAHYFVELQESPNPRLFQCRTEVELRLCKVSHRGSRMPE